MITSHPRAWSRRITGGAGARHDGFVPEIPWFQMMMPRARCGPDISRLQNARSTQ